VALDGLGVGSRSPGAASVVGVGYKLVVLGESEDGALVALGIPPGAVGAEAVEARHVEEAVGFALREGKWATHGLVLVVWG